MNVVLPALFGENENIETNDNHAMKTTNRAFDLYSESFPELEPLPSACGKTGTPERSAALPFLDWALLARINGTPAPFGSAEPDIHDTAFLEFAESWAVETECSVGALFSHVGSNAPLAGFSGVVRSRSLEAKAPAQQGQSRSSP